MLRSREVVDHEGLPYAGKIIVEADPQYPDYATPKIYVRCQHCETLTLEPLRNKDRDVYCDICHVFFNVKWEGQDEYVPL